MSQLLKRAFQAIPKVTRDITNPQKVDMTGDWRSKYKFKTKFGMIGPVEAGKSTICAFFMLTCQIQSAIKPNFYVRVLPDSSYILNDANRLRQGHFPDKTDPMTPKAPQAGFLICQRGMTGNTGVHVPICDVAGEITDYLSDEGAGNTPYEKLRNRYSSINMQVIATVRDCQGFIIALDAKDALMFSDGTHDNDSYMHNALTNIFEWRRRNNQPDPYVIIILTKWDQVMTEAKDLGMDAYDGEYGLQRFLDNGFPATSMLLKPLRDKKRVYYFRSWVNLLRDPNSKKVEYWADGKPKIKIIENPQDYIRYKPDYSEPDYVQMTELIGRFGK